MMCLILTKYLLDYAKDHGGKRLLYISSGEVYGQGDLSLESFEESYAGYVDPTSPRSCYPNGKRAAETLCVSYTKQFGIDTVIVRPSHTYGPTATKADNRANAQFVNKGLAGEDIVLKSEGNQLYSYSYVADAVSALLYCLLYGECGQAYNVADPGSDIALKDLARIVADYAGRQVVFELPDAKEAAGYSTATKAVLDAAKLRSLGWSAHYDMKNGLIRTIVILRDSNHTDA